MSITTLSIIVQKYASYLDHNDKIGMVGGSFRRRFLFSEGFATRMCRDNTERERWSTQNILWKKTNQSSQAICCVYAQDTIFLDSCA